jgi:hypothetical protein
MLNTSQLRSAWSPACVRRHHFDPMYRGLDAWFEEFDYRPGPGSGAANCRDITGGTLPSLHSYFDDGGQFVFWNGFVIPLMALAVDINPGRNPYGPRLVTDMPRAMVDGITGLRTNSGHQMIQWGGYFGGPYDAMHYQGCCTPAQMATGIRVSTLPKPAPTPTPTPSPEPEEDDMPKPLLFRLDAKDPAVLYMSSARQCWHVPNAEALQGYKLDMEMNGLSPDVCVLSKIDNAGTKIDELYDFVVTLPWIGPFPTNWAAGTWKGKVLT